MSGRVARGL